MTLAGFTQDDRGLHFLPLSDPARAREALTQLTQAARDCRVSVTTSNSPYLGDIAQAVTEQLPGCWEAAVEKLPEQRHQEDMMLWLWDDDLLPPVMRRSRVPVCAILRDGVGTELLLIERPSDGRYLVGALVPSPDSVNATAPPPRTVSAPNALAAATAVRTQLLPAYERAVLLSRLSEAEEDLRWAHETYEPGCVRTPYPTDLDAALDRFATHATEFVAALRRRSDRPLTAQEKAFLDHVEGGLEAARQTDEGPVRSGEGAASSADPMALWLTEGEHLLEMVRTAITPPALASAASRGPGAVRTSLPPPPPPPATVGGPRR
ncbi:MULTISPECIES: hypothetical protein [Streptomyces]|uniref:hypothetical protein n=1 Tax=Streptomyces TaxID=1883 RepID=UPI00163BEECE|nr:MULTISPECIES: hypothetical protein [Streptomyces]MBC2878064.1 hypothetical protein [Streptomyces sp. TYQ1024]UBI40016.1 hypothetical protein K7I03_28490 [Streptomyces mobaraensis]UKW32597.1 hypothetical protein MCU78_28420 [Streptomyces sp. TYQ1024]